MRHKDIHSLPTRRSSDLERTEEEWKQNEQEYGWSKDDEIKYKRDQRKRRYKDFESRQHEFPELGLSEAEKKEFIDRKSTRLNSSHLGISYAVFCLKKKKK